MCNNDKCFYCIPVTTACFIFAIVNAIANVLLLITCCSMIAAWCITDRTVLIKEDDDYNRDNIENMFFNVWIPYEYLLPLLTLSSLLTLIFSLVLVNAVDNRLWKHVKAYFIYGTVVTILWVLASVIQVCSDQSPDIGLWGLFACVLHSWFLVLVHQTYRHLVDTGYVGHAHLEDNDIRLFELPCSDCLEP